MHTRRPEYSPPLVRCAPPFRRARGTREAFLLLFSFFATFVARFFLFFNELRHLFVISPPF